MSVVICSALKSKPARRPRPLVVRRRVVLSPAGELDLRTTPRLRRILDANIARGHRDITLDLRDVSFADGSFVHAVVTAYERLHRRGGSLRIVNASGSAALVLRLSGLPHQSLHAPASPKRTCPHRAG